MLGCLHFTARLCMWSHWKHALLTWCCAAKFLLCISNQTMIPCRHPVDSPPHWPLPPSSDTVQRKAFIWLSSTCPAQGLWRLVYPDLLDAQYVLCATGHSLPPSAPTSQPQHAQPHIKPGALHHISTEALPLQTRQPSPVGPQRQQSSSLRGTVHSGQTTSHDLPRPPGEQQQQQQGRQADALQSQVTTSLGKQPRSSTSTEQGSKQQIRSGSRPDLSPWPTAIDSRKNSNTGWLAGQDDNLAFLASLIAGADHN